MRFGRDHFQIFEIANFNGAVVIAEQQNILAFVLCYLENSKLTCCFDELLVDHF